MAHQIAHFKQFISTLTLRYYERFSYDPQIAEAILDFENSPKGTEDENKVIDALEYLTMKKLYASSNFEMMFSKDRPPTLKIIDLLICIEEIAVKKYSNLEEHTAKYLETPEKFDQKAHESTLDEYETFFERITDCLTRICDFYSGWQECGLPLLLMKYMMYHSRSLKFDFKFNQLMRNLTLVLMYHGKEHDIQRPKGIKSGPFYVALLKFPIYTRGLMPFLEAGDLDAFKIIEKISKARNGNGLKVFQEDLVQFISSSLENKKCKDNIERFFKSLCDENILSKNFKLSNSWACDLLLECEDESDDLLSGVYELAGIFKFFQMLADKTLSSEAIMSLVSTQRFVCTIMDNASQEEKEYILEGIINTSHLETERALLLSKDPKSALSNDFAFILDSFVSVAHLSMYYLRILPMVGKGRLQAKLFVIAKEILDSWFSSVSNKMIVLLWNIHNNSKEIKKGKALSNLLFDSPDKVYYEYIFSILHIIDQLDSLSRKAEELEPILGVYEFVRPEMFKLIEEEYLSAFESSFESDGLIYVSRFFIYEFKRIREGMEEFLKSGVKITEMMVEKIFKLEELLDPSKSVIRTSQSQDKYIFMNYHSTMVSYVKFIVCLDQFPEPGPKQKLVKSLRVDEVLKFFEGLRAKENLNANELSYKIIANYYGLFFGVCSFTLGTKDVEEGIPSITLSQFKKMLELSLSFYYPSPFLAYVMTDIPCELVNFGKDKADYLRTFHSSGFAEFICKEMYFDLNRRKFSYRDLTPDIEGYVELKIEVFKKVFYNQLIEDKKYDQVRIVVKISKEKMLSFGESLKKVISTFQIAQNVEKNRFVGDFWRYSFYMRTFILALSDLLEQSKTRGFEKETEAQALMKTLQDSIQCAFQIYMSLPLSRKLSPITKHLVELLRNSNAEAQLECLKILRNSVNASLNKDNDEFAAAKYIAALKLSESEKEITLSDDLAKVPREATSSNKLNRFFEFDSLFAFLDAIDQKLIQKVTQKIQDEKLLVEDFQNLIIFWKSFTMQLNHQELPVEKVQKITGMVSKHYFGFLNLCHDKAPERIIQMLSDHLTLTLENTKESDSKGADFEKLLVATSLTANVFQYYMKQAEDLTKEIAVLIRGFLGQKGFIGLIMTASVELEKLIGAFFNGYQHRESKSSGESEAKKGEGEKFEEEKMEKFEKNAEMPEKKDSKGKSDEEQREDEESEVDEEEEKVWMEFIAKRALFARSELKLFLDTFVDKKILRETFVSNLFVDIEGEFQEEALLIFFRELLEGSIHLTRIDDTSDPSYDPEIIKSHETLIQAIIRFEREVINLIFFSSVKNPVAKEMADHFYNEVFVYLLRLSCSVACSESREIWSLLAKFEAQREDNRKIILDISSKCNDKVEKLNGTDIITMKEVIKYEMDPNPSSEPPHKMNFFNEISFMIRYNNQIFGILNSNVKELIEQCLPFSELNLKICLKLFECFKDFKLDDLNALFQKKLNPTDHKYFCRYSVEAVSNSSSIFQKINKGDDPTNTKKLIGEFYSLCILLLKPGKKLDIFRLTNYDDEAAVLGNLFAVLENFPDKFDQFFTENEDILAWIVEIAEDQKKGYWLLHLLVKTLGLNCDIKESILMHVASQGIKNVDFKTFSGDFNNNLFNVFYPEAFNSIYKEALVPEHGRVKLSGEIKDLPCVDPEKLILNKRGEWLFKNFLKTMQSAAENKKELEGFGTIIASLISVHPHVVILLSQAVFKQTLLTKQSFLEYLMQYCVAELTRISLLKKFMNSLINPQMQSQLILHKGEIIPTTTYHRELISEWLIEILNNMSYMSPAEVIKGLMPNCIMAFHLVFRDVHLLSDREIELSYQISEKSLDLLRLCTKVADEKGKQLLFSFISTFFIPLKQILYFQTTSEHLDQTYPEFLFNYNPMIAVGVREYFYKQQKLQDVLDFTKEKIEEHKQMEQEKHSKPTQLKKQTEISRPKANPIPISTKLSEDDHSYLITVYNSTQILFGRRIMQTQTFAIRQADQTHSELFEKEIRLILSKLSSNITNFSNSKSIRILEEKDQESQNRGPSPSICGNHLNALSVELNYSITEKLAKLYQMNFRTNSIRSLETLASSLSFEDFLSGSNTKEELAELARAVKAKFRKYFEPILEEKFVNDLQHRKVLSTVQTEETEKELAEFLNKLTRKEYIAFMLFTEEEIFNKQPIEIRRILTDLRRKVRALLATSEFYAQPSNKSTIFDSDASTTQTRLEKLVTLETKSKNNNLFEELEYHLLSKIDYNIPPNYDTEANLKAKRSAKKDSDSSTSFYFKVFDILEEHMQRKDAHPPKEQKKIRRIPKIPNSLLEKLILLPVIMHSNPESVAEYFSDVLIDIVDLVRLLDLSLRIFAIPDQKFNLLLTTFQSHFDFKLPPGLIPALVKTSINSFLVSLLEDRLIEPLSCGPFGIVNQLVEQAFGVLELTQKIASFCPIPYPPKQTFYQLWIQFFERVKVPGKKERKKLMILSFSSVIQSMSMMKSKEEEISLVGQEKDPNIFNYGESRIYDMDLYAAVKNPRTFEFFMETCSSSRSKESLRSIQRVCEQFYTGFSVVSASVKQFDLSDLNEIGLEIMFYHVEWLNNIYIALIRFIKQTIERLGQPNSYTTIQRNSLNKFHKLLKDFLNEPFMIQIQSSLAGNMEVMERRLEDDVPDNLTIAFFDNNCTYILLFYKLSQMQEELEYVLSSGNESHNSCLMNIKSKIVARDLEEPKLEKSLSKESAERSRSLDDIMYRVSKGCNEVFEIYEAFRGASHIAMTVLPRVLSQRTRVQLIRRESILEDTLMNFDSLEPAEINPNLKLNINFIGEVGVDHGGLTTEWAAQILKILLDPSYGLFQLSSNNISFQPSPNSAIIPGNHRYYRLIGRIIGYVIANGIAVSANFTKPMIKQLLGSPLTPDDLNDVDPELSSSLQWMMNNKINTEALLQEFSFEFRFLDNYYTIDLNEELANQKVNEDNKKLFVEHLVYYKLSKSIEAPLAEIKAGIIEFLSSDFLRLLNPADLHSLLAGETNVNIEEMKKYSKTHNHAPSQEVISWFWEIVQELEKDQLSALLFFITGNSVVGFGGFKEYPIILRQSFKSPESLPLAHTCFSMIDLPDYPTKEVMKEKLLKAVFEGQGFHLA